MVANLSQCITDVYRLASCPPPCFTFPAHKYVASPPAFPFTNYYLRMKLASISGLLIVLLGVEAMRPINLKPRWREFFEEVMAEADNAELNIFGKAIDGSDEGFSLEKIDKKTITYKITSGLI